MKEAKNNNSTMETPGRIFFNIRAKTARQFAWDQNQNQHYIDSFVL